MSRPIFNAYILSVISAFCFAFFARSSVALLSYSGHLKELAWINMGEICILLVVGIPLVRTMGIVGISIATLIAVLLKAGASLVLAKRYTKLKPATII